MTNKKHSTHNQAINFTCTENERATIKRNLLFSVFFFLIQNKKLDWTSKQWTLVQSTVIKFIAVERICDKIALFQIQIFG